MAGVGGAWLVASFPTAAWASSSALRLATCFSASCSSFLITVASRGTIGVVCALLSSTVAFDGVGLLGTVTAALPPTGDTLTNGPICAGPLKRKKYPTVARHMSAQHRPKMLTPI